MSRSPLVRIFEAVTAETVLAEHDVVLYEYSCEKTGKWKWSLGTVQQLITSQSHNSSVLMQDWILPSSTRTSRLSSFVNTPVLPSALQVPGSADSTFENGVQFTPGKSVTTVPRSSVFAKFKVGIAQVDQPILLSKSDLSQIRQLLRLRCHAVENSVNSEELMAMMRSLLHETAQREELYQIEIRESLSDQFKQLVQLMELQALKEGGVRPYSTSRRSSSLTQSTPDETSLSAVKLKLQQAKISALELVVRDEEGSRLALLKDESYQAMDIAVGFYQGFRELSGTGGDGGAPSPLQLSAAKIEELRYQLRARESAHLIAVEKLQEGVNSTIEACPEKTRSVALQKLIDTVDAAVELLSRDGCEAGVHSPTPIPKDVRYDMTLRFASVRSAVASGAASREHSLSAAHSASANRSSLVSRGLEFVANPCRSPSPGDPVGKPLRRDEERDGRPTQVLPAPAEWSLSEPSVGSRNEEQDQLIAKLRSQVEEERDRRLVVEGRISQMTTATEELLSTQSDSASSFNEAIALQRRMLQQLQMEIANRMAFMNTLDEQLCTMRRSKHTLMSTSRVGVRQPTDDTEELYAQFNRRIAILLTQRGQIQEGVLAREKEIRASKSLLASALALTSTERRSGSYRRIAEDFAGDWRPSSEEREQDAIASA